MSAGFRNLLQKAQYNELKPLRCLAGERGTDGESLPPETLPEVLVAWFLKNDFRYRYAASAMAHYSAKGPSPQAGDPGFLFTSSDYYSDGEGEAKWDSAD